MKKLLFIVLLVSLCSCNHHSPDLDLRPFRMFDKQKDSVMLAEWNDTLNYETIRNRGNYMDTVYDYFLMSEKEEILGLFGESQEIINTTLPYLIDYDSPYTANLEELDKFYDLNLDFRLGILPVELNDLSTITYKIGMGASGPNALILIFDERDKCLGSMFCKRQ